jgi:hypothetical protein
LSSNVVSALVSAANISTSANIAANYFIGNGSQLTGISSNKIFNGTSEANIGSVNGNANISINGTSNVAVFTTTGLNITGTVSASGNITGSNVNAAGLSLSSNVISALNVTGAIAGANITTPGLISASGNITGANATLTASTVSTTTATGALVVTGGLGVGGNIYATAVYDNSVRVLTENSTVDGGTY